jgi:hypothetical protein
MSNIPKRVSATVAAHANDTVNELANRDITDKAHSFVPIAQQTVNGHANCHFRGSS